MNRIKNEIRIARFNLFIALVHALMKVTPDSSATVTIRNGKYTIT